MDDTPASLKSFSIVEKLGKKMIRHYCNLRHNFETNSYFKSDSISYIDLDAPSMNCSYCKKNWQFEALRTELGL